MRAQARIPADRNGLHVRALVVEFLDDCVADLRLQRLLDLAVKGVEVRHQVRGGHEPLILVGVLGLCRDNGWAGTHT